MPLYGVKIKVEPENDMSGQVLETPEAFLEAVKEESSEQFELEEFLQTPPDTENNKAHVSQPHPNVASDDDLFIMKIGDGHYSICKAEKTSEDILGNHNENYGNLSDGGLENEGINFINLPSDGGSDDESASVDSNDEMTVPVNCVRNLDTNADGLCWYSDDDLTHHQGATSHQPVWKNTYQVNPNARFQEPCGLSPEVSGLRDKSPVALFNLFFPDKVLADISFQTNLFSEQVGSPFRETDVSEIKVFLAINLLMGMKRLPCCRDYWSSYPDFNDPYISPLMSLHRFGWLLTHLHLRDNSLMPKKGEPNFDKLYKIRPLIDVISQKCESLLMPHEFQSVGELMIKGQSSFKQYVPSKHIKRGYRIWLRVDKSGFVSKFEIDDGVNSHKMAKRLCEPLAGKNHSVFFDNCLISFQLICDMHDKKICACGAVTPMHKHIPQLTNDRDMNRGEVDWMTSKNVSCLKWKDKRCITLLSNFHDPRSMSEVIRKEKEGTFALPCPQMVIDYHTHMRYVDYFDNLKSSYEVVRKSKKWWHRIFFYLLDLAVVNSFVLYKMLDDVEKMDLKQFRRHVIWGLIGLKSQKPNVDPPVPVKQHRRVVPAEIRLVEANHLPVIGTYRRCALCSTRGATRRSKLTCNTCKVALCLKKGRNCYQLYHTRNFM